MGTRNQGRLEESVILKEKENSWPQGKTEPDRIIDEK